jgi:hypothetical protein
MPQDSDVTADSPAEPSAKKADLAIDFSRSDVPVPSASEEPGESHEDEFDRAEFDEGEGQNCASCKAHVAGQFYSVNGVTVCAPCGKGLAEHQKGGTTPIGLLRAIAFGSVPAAIGGLAWWALLAYTGYQLALIAIAIGFGVGAAVRMASRGRGGLAYQIIAVALTYFSVASAYVPFAMGNPTNSFGDALLLALKAPFQGEGGSMLLGLAILAFGLWQAFKMNAHTPLDVSGPHEIAEPATQT